MTKTEALAKIKELENYIEDLDNKIGFENDELFLLSIDEYNRYKDVIDGLGSICWWWLRSPGNDGRYAAGVYFDGSVFEYGYGVSYVLEAVRPALKLASKFELYVNGTFIDKVPVGTRVLYKDFPFICIDEEKKLFIAEVPIGFHRFDKKSNNYATSEIRQYIKDWAKDRR